MAFDNIETIICANCNIWKAVGVIGMLHLGIIQKSKTPALMQNDDFTQLSKTLVRASVSRLFMIGACRTFISGGKPQIGPI